MQSIFIFRGSKVFGQNGLILITKFNYYFNDCLISRAHRHHQILNFTHANFNYHLFVVLFAFRLSSVTEKLLFWILIRWLTWPLENIPFLRLCLFACSCFLCTFRVIIHLQCEALERPISFVAFCLMWASENSYCNFCQHWHYQ